MFGSQLHKEKYKTTKNKVNSELYEKLTIFAIKFQNACSLEKYEEKLIIN